MPVIEERYREIVAAVDAEFVRNRELHGDRIHCRPGCTDCCHQSFPITEIEATVISQGMQTLDAQLRASLEDRARAYIEACLLGRTHLPCPALEEGVCSIYDFRPLMCHKFGMPLYNPEKPDRVFACELNFKDGEEIKDPELIQIQSGIHRNWKLLQMDYSASNQHVDSGRLTVAHAILLASSQLPPPR